MQLWGLLLWLQAVGAVIIQQFFPAGFKSDLAGTSSRGIKEHFLTSQKAEASSTRGGSRNQCSSRESAPRTQTNTDKNQFLYS